MPDERELSRLTQTALHNLRYGLLQEAKLPPRPDQPPRPVPERVGEPSVFKHVIYIIQENRTYDQVLGDLPQGNGDPSLCIFGEHITPNHHKVARDFVLLDNTYCSGILSADGHQWADSAIASDYLERSFAGFPRSYPFGGTENAVDALAYSSAGFIWDNAIAHGKTLRDYGEFAFTEALWRDKSKKRAPGFPGLLPRLREPDGRDRDQLPVRPSNRCGPTLSPIPRAGRCTFPTSSGRRSSSKSCGSSSRRGTSRT